MLILPDSVYAHMSPESLNATIVPFLFAVGSVAVGAVLALLPGVGARSLGPVQTFSVAAALTVVLVHLIPESADSIGMWALVGFAVGLVAPLFIEGLLDRVARLRTSASPLDHDVITAEVGFAGLLVHQVGDGIGLWVTSGGGESSLNAAFALSAHTVPLATLFVLRFATLKGLRSALVHAAGLAAASAIGIILGSIVPGEVISQFNPWIEAIVAGLLLHVITHDLHVEKNRTTVIKILDMAALVIGVGVTLLASYQHGVDDSGHDHTGIGREAFLHAIFDLAVAAAPVLLAGLLGAAALQVLGAKLRSWLAKERGNAVHVARGIAAAAVDPVSSTRVLDVARRMYLGGSSTGFIVGFMVAIPALGIETLALSWNFLGADLAAARLAGAVLLAGCVGVVAAGFARYRTAAGPVIGELLEPPDEPSAARGFVRAFDNMLLHASPWMVVGLIAAAYVQTLMPAEQVQALTRLGLDVPLMVLAATPTYIGAATSTPLAAVLLSKGISPGAVVAGLVIGPAVNLAVFTFVRRMVGTRATWVVLGTSVAIALGIAYTVNGFVGSTQPVELPADHEHGIAAIAAAVTVLAFTARSLWQTGLRAWVSSLLGMSTGEVEAGHAHGHHGHVH